MMTSGDKSFSILVVSIAVVVVVFLRTCAGFDPHGSYRLSDCAAVCHGEVAYVDSTRCCCR